MSETKWIDKFPMKVVLAAVSIICFFLAIYTAFIQKKRPCFQYSIVSETSIFNQKEDVSSITIFVDSLDVRKSDSNVSIYYIKVENCGNEDIAYGDYDKGLFGIQVSDGVVLEGPEFVAASTDHLVNRFKEIDVQVDSSFVPISCLPLDENDYYIVKIAILHHNNSEPHFSAIGKISGQKNISIFDIRHEVPSIWTIAFSGRLEVQLLRGVVYFLILIIILIVCAAALSILDDYIDKSRRKKIVKKARESNSGILSFVIDDYEKRGEFFIYEVLEIVNKGAKKINDEYCKSMKYASPNNVNITQRKKHIDRLEFYEDLIKKGYLNKGENGTLVIVGGVKNSLKYICNELPAKNGITREILKLNDLDDNITKDL